MAAFHFRRLLRAALFFPLKLAAFACVHLPVSPAFAVPFLRAVARVLWAVDSVCFRRLGGRS